MDLQGTPIGSSKQGMKNTSDPERYTNPKTEGAGVVAPDSLAAESARSGGGFGANRDSNSFSGEGGKSTLNTAATTLAPAPDAAEREAKAAWSETSDDVKGPGGQKYPEGVGGQPDFPGHHNLDGYVGGSTRAKEETASSGMGLRGPSEPSNSTGSSGQIAESDNNSAPTENTFKGEGGSSSVDAAPRPSGPSSSTGSSGQIAGSDNKSAPTENTFKGEGDSSVNAAPGYVGSVVSEANRTGKPKGKNITEGGFDDDPSKNASFNSDIGSEDDPGMKAIGDMQRKTQNVSGGTGPRQAPGDSDNSQYDVLETDQQL